MLFVAVIAIIIDLFRLTRIFGSATVLVWGLLACVCISRADFVAIPLTDNIIVASSLCLADRLFLTTIVILAFCAFYLGLVIAICVTYNWTLFSVVPCNRT